MIAPPDGRVGPPMLENVERMPRDTEAEASVLGSILTDPGTLNTVKEVLGAADFTDGRHREIFEAMLSLQAKGVPADFQTVSSELRARGKYDGVGGLLYLSDLVGVVPTAVHVQHYAHIVADCAERRRLIALAGTLAAQAYDGSFHINAVVDSARRALEVNLKPIEIPVSGSLSLREVSAADLKARGAAAIESLPFLGAPGYFMKGWATLVASYPKCGKTELMARCVMKWTDEKVLFVTEEPESIWADRLSKLLGECDHIRLLFGLGVKREQLLARIEAGDETVIVIDTCRNVLGLVDEKDNSEIARVLGPFVAITRMGGKSLVLLHHLNKAGGEDGRAITGGHAFLGIVDVALEIAREPNLGLNKRKVRGWGRLRPIEEIIYELREDGSMAIVGSPKAVEFDVVKERALETLDGEWARTQEVRTNLGEPAPSLVQLREALNALFRAGLIARDPAIEKRGATYRYRRVCEPNLKPPFSKVSSEVEIGEPELYGGPVPAEEELGGRG